MSKRLTIFLLMLLGVVLLLAQTTKSQIHLTATKVELSGEVKLVWTKPLSANNTTEYDLYRAKLPDTTIVKIHTTSDLSYVDKVPPTISATPQLYAYKVIARTAATIEHSNIVYVPVPGIPNVGAFKLEGRIDSNKVKLQWDIPPAGNVSYYLVYRGQLGDNTPLHTKIDSTMNRWSITDAPIPINPNYPVTFVFYVKAKLVSGETIVSTTLQLTMYPKPNRDELKFISVPPLFAQKDVKYQYTAKAVSSDPTAIIRYYAEFNSNALGLVFKIDSITGVVDWTPTVKAIIPIKIVAKSNKGATVKQEFSVVVAGGNGIIQGKVTDTLNVPIPNTIIEVFKSENNLVFTYGYTARTDANGNYRIVRVDPGNYKLRANAPSGKYQSQWYDGKREVSQANIVAVSDSPSVSIANFKLRGGPNNAAKITVNGTVTDTSGLAIGDSSTHVIFVRADFALNFGGGTNTIGENLRKYFEMNFHGDFRLEGNSEFVFKKKVEVDGKYSLQLPPGVYVAFARSKGYAVEFYQEESNFLSADFIRLPDLRVPPMEITYDFTLSPLPPVVLGEITGSVMDSVKDIFVPSRVIAFRDGWRQLDPHSISRAYLTDTDSTGVYKFENLLPGKYIVMALPLGNYAPAFYSIDTLNHRWKRATKIEVNGNSVDDINIYVKPFGPSANGYTGITGTVAMSGGNGNGNNSNRAGVIVYAYRNNEVAGYAFTNIEGNYFIGGLSPGQYTVSVDKPGFEETGSVTTNATYDGSGNPIVGTANFSINSTTSVTVHPSVQPTNFVLEQNYPNPFNPSTVISYQLPMTSYVTLTVYDVIGREVATLVNEMKVAGSYNVQFDASKLASGIYFYRLEFASTHIVKKMMLLK